MDELRLTPIGILHCDRHEKVEAPRQPAAAERHRGVIELLPGHHYEHALEDLDGWERIWILFWFHRNAGWRPKVLPPRSTDGRKGVFATRSPHRPNPLGLSAVKLLRVEGLSVHVEGVDLLEGTPVLDIKPYVAYADAWPDSRSGWLAGVADPAPGWSVTFDDLAERQVAWIEQHAPLQLRERIVSTLALGPQPHPYRRIRRQGDDGVLAIREWRARFTVSEREIHVRTIESGYRPTERDAIALHREYVSHWGEQR